MKPNPVHLLALAMLPTLLPLSATAAAAAVTVAVQAPANGGATVASPVHFTASATTTSSGAIVTGWHIYDGSASIYGTSGPTGSIDQTIALSTGDHSITVRAWDSTGAFGSQALTIHVGTGSSHYQSDAEATAAWLAASSTAADGAILYTSDQINPYYGNLAALGWTKTPAYDPNVKAWMEWYLGHLNWPDRWGLYGTVYDYTVAANGAETSTGDADSTDSYAATFLSLAWAFYQTGDPDAQAYVKTLDYQLDVIGGVIVQTQQSDGLTWAKPDYHIKYLMDASEAYRGLSDLASLYQTAFGDSAKASYYSAHAAEVANGIEAQLWDAAHGAYFPYRGEAGSTPPPANWSTWYPDATSQLFPLVEGVIDPGGSRAASLYNQFNGAFPNWPTLGFPDDFPWVVVAAAAALAGDGGRVDTYLGSIDGKYVSRGFPWTWYSAEAGWFIRVNEYRLGKRPL